MAGLLAASPAVYALALLPAVLWGFSPILSKRGMAAGGTAVQAALVVVVVDSTVYWTVLLVRQGLDVFASLTPLAVGVFAVAGVFGTALGRIAVFVGVDRVGASVNSAGISTRPLFATLLAVAFLGESVGVWTAIGILVLVAGLVALALSEGGDIRGWEPWELVFPVAAAVFFAIGNVLRRWGLLDFPGTTLEAVAINEAAAFVVLLSYAAARSSPAEFRTLPRESYWYFAGSGLITAVALLSLFAAFAHPEGRVAIVDPLAAIAPLFTAVFAAGLLGDLERVTRGVVAGAVLVTVGVVLVTAGPT